MMLHTDNRSLVMIRPVLYKESCELVTWSDGNEETGISSGVTLGTCLLIIYVIGYRLAWAASSADLLHGRNGKRLQCALCWERNTTVISSSQQRYFAAYCPNWLAAHKNSQRVEGMGKVERYPNVWLTLTDQLSNFSYDPLKSLGRILRP